MSIPHTPQGLCICCSFLPNPTPTPSYLTPSLTSSGHQMLPPPLTGLSRPHDLKLYPSQSSSTSLPCPIFLPQTFCSLTVSSFVDTCLHQSGRSIRAGLHSRMLPDPATGCLGSHLFGAWMVKSNFYCNSLPGKASSQPLLMACPP